MKKYILTVFIIATIVLASGCINQTDNNTPPKNYSSKGMSFNYPNSWNTTLDDVNGTDVQVMVQDTSNNPPAAFMAVKIEKISGETLNDFKTMYMDYWTSKGANITESSASNTTVNGINANESIYTGNSPDGTIQLRLIYFEHEKFFYAMAFLVENDDLQSQKTNFDVILNSFKIQ